MHIDIAITNLESQIRDIAPGAHDDDRESLKLGREALIRLRYLRQKPCITQKTPLESESVD